MFSSRLFQNSRPSDLVGAATSGLCLIHCLATPFLFVAQAGIATHHGGSPLWWGLIDVPLLLISLIAVYWAAKKTSKPWMKIALSASWSMLAILILNEEFGSYHLAKSWIYVSSGSLLVLHLYNSKYCQGEDEMCNTIPEEKSVELLK